MLVVVNCDDWPSPQWTVTVQGPIPAAESVPSWTVAAMPSTTSLFSELEGGVKVGGTAREVTITCAVPDPSLPATVKVTV